MPHRIDQQDLCLTASIGIVTYPDDGMEAETLLKHADLAMYRAKGSGRNTYRFFGREMRKNTAERVQEVVDQPPRRNEHRPRFTPRC
jgi:predicted signal transduction protein with EAL and GGDEF domain